MLARQGDAHTPCAAGVSLRSGGQGDEPSQGVVVKVGGVEQGQGVENPVALCRAETEARLQVLPSLVGTGRFASRQPGQGQRDCLRIARRIGPGDRAGQRRSRVAQGQRQLAGGWRIVGRQPAGQRFDGARLMAAAARSIRVHRRVVVSKP